MQHLEGEPRGGCVTGSVIGLAPPRGDWLTVGPGSECSSQGFKQALTIEWRADQHGPWLPLTSASGERERLDDSS